MRHPVPHSQLRAGAASAPGTIQAAHYLRRHLAGSGKLPTYLHGHWLAAGLWQRVGWFDVSETTLLYLQERLPQLPASSLAWLLNSLRLGGVPAGHALVQSAATHLVRLQESDGRWTSEDGPGHYVSTTLAALHALGWARPR
ncbi:MAG: hypothetical protein AB1445_04390 [Bacillota bacterium]